MPPCPPCARRSRGFTLIELVVVMLVLGVLLAMASMVARGVIAAQKRSLTATRMALVDAALVQYVMQQKRLPCPANGALESAHADAGIEGARDLTAGCTNMQNGVVPWRALALTETEATDGWDRRLTYRVFPQLAANGGMDMSWCDPAGEADAEISPPFCKISCTSSACTSPKKFLLNKGLRVRSIAGAVVMDPAAVDPAPNTGAAYVVISHGESGGGGYLGSGQLATTSSADGTEELKNYASQPYVLNVTYYVDDATNDSPGAAHFDDILSRPSIMAVVSKAGLAPRPH